ncbi:MAG: cupredoxin domain-containing protein [Armatimonadota bacterium]
MLRKCFALTVCSAVLFGAGFVGSEVDGSTVGAKKPVLQTAKIKMTASGFSPSTISLKKGIPAVITFTRVTDKGCGTQVVIPDYSIKKDLPVNKPVIVKFTPAKTGTVTMTCGMGMLRGKIVVK